MTRTSIATVCLSGTLEEKIDAVAAAGFDGVEIFDADLLAAPSAPREIRERCADLGLRIELYQPFRDLDSTDPARLAANLRRLDDQLDVVAELGTDLLLVCSSVAADAVTDDGRLAEQLHTAAERAATRGVRLAYEALAWGTCVRTHRRAWDVVRRADHPACGVCLDSFHVLARKDDPAGIREIPAGKLFAVQLSDSLDRDGDVIEWSRHHRLFPGLGTWDLAGFVEHVRATGYAGPLSLEVFNDGYRHADPRRIAAAARRSLRSLIDPLRAAAVRAHKAGTQPGPR